MIIKKGVMRSRKKERFKNRITSKYWLASIQSNETMDIGEQKWVEALYTNDRAERMHSSKKN